MNRTDKPKMTSKALVDKLRDEKGVSFKYVTEDNAEKYLAQINNPELFTEQYLNW